MRLPKTCTRSIRTKLIVMIVVPILFFFVIAISLTTSKLVSEARQQLGKQVIQQAKNYAAILDSEFNAIARLARINTGFIEDNSNFENELLITTLRNTVNNVDIVYGGGIIYGIDTENDVEDFIYIYKNRDDNDKLIKFSSVNSYLIKRMRWYQDALATGNPVWSEPYIDLQTREVLIATIAVPFYKEDQFAGVSIIDIDLLRLQKHSGLESLTDRSFAITSKTGRFITHPDAGFIMQKTIEDYAREMNDPGLVALAEDMLQGRSGQQFVERLSTQIDGPFWVFYAPIKSTGWGFATAMPEKEVLAFARSQILYGLIGISLIIIFAIICVMIVANNLTKPILRLNDAVEKLGQGDLSVNLNKIKTEDELGQLSQAFNSMTVQLRKHVEEIKKQHAARDAVESEFQVARQIQSSLMPHKFPAFPEQDEFDLFAINYPASHVAGDFFDFFMLDEERLFIVIADVSGKGIGPALMMAVTRTHIRNLASKGKAPAAILNELNNLLIKDREEAIFVTVFVAEYNIKDGSLCYANGGHVPPYLINKDGIVGQFGGPTGTIVGMLDDIEYEQETIQLKDSETMVLYTDGILEARLTDGEFFGEQHFITFLSSNGDMAIDELCDTAFATVKAYQGNRLSDDVTMLVLRRLK